MWTCVDQASHTFTCCIYANIIEHDSGFLWQADCSDQSEHKAAALLCNFFYFLKEATDANFSSIITEKQTGKS